MAWRAIAALIALGFVVPARADYELARCAIDAGRMVEAATGTVEADDDRDDLASKMTPAQIASAQKAEANWMIAATAKRTVGGKSAGEMPTGAPQAQSNRGVHRSAELTEYSAGMKFQDCRYCPVMVVVPPDLFKMGSSAIEEGRQENEGPQRWVDISTPFAIGKYEVTFREWEACVKGGGCNRYLPDSEGWGRGRRPVINVSWKDAQSYALWLSQKTGKRYRLPSEAEWEYAARAGTTGPFHMGSTISTNQANYAGEYIYGTGRKGIYRKKTMPVGSFPPNAFGLHDVHGNVWEWIEDCWHHGYAGAPGDGDPWITGGAQLAGGDCFLRVVRGGSWDDTPDNLRSAARNSTAPGTRVNLNGFRVVRTLDQ